MDSDQELIELVNEGDADAFEALYYRYRDWVYRLAWRFTGNQQDTLGTPGDLYLSVRQVPRL